jgi:hypothetical protein
MLFGIEYHHISSIGCLVALGHHLRPFLLSSNLQPHMPLAQSLPEAASPSTHQSIFDGALEVYKRKTGRDLSSHPLLRRLETCHSPDAILDVLQTQVLGPHQSRNSGDKLTRCLNPTVNAFNSFSATIGGGISLVSLRNFRVTSLESAT